jgi:hypothetical protein
MLPFEHGHPILQDCLSSLMKHFYGTDVVFNARIADINVWNLETEACTHHFHDSGGPYRPVRSVHFYPAGDKDHKCVFVTSDGTLIRTCWGDPHGDMMSDVVDLSGLGQVRKSIISHCGSLLAALSSEGFMSGGSVRVSLHNRETVRWVRRVAMDDRTPGPHDVFAFSPNGKALVRHKILVLQVHNLNITNPCPP